MIIDAKFTSVWDGGLEVTTPCKINTETREVFDIEISEGTADIVNELDEEFVTIGEKEYPVIRKDNISSEESENIFWYL